LQRALDADADADGEEAAVFAVPADNHAADRSGARRLDRQTQRAAVEEIDDRGVAKEPEIQPRIILASNRSLIETVKPARGKAT
jgi:hypothetical protein